MEIPNNQVVVPGSELILTSEEFFVPLDDMEEHIGGHVIQLYMICTRRKLAIGRGLRQGVDAVTTILLDPDFFVQLYTDWCTLHPNDIDGDHASRSDDYSRWIPHEDRENNHWT